MHLMVMSYSSCCIMPKNCNKVLESWHGLRIQMQALRGVCGCFSITGHHQACVQSSGHHLCTLWSCLTHHVVVCQKTAKNCNVSWRSKRQLCRGVGHAKRLASDLDNDSVHSGLQVGDSDCPSMSGAHVASRLQKLAQERQTPEARKWKQSITSTSSLNLCQGSHSTSR